MSRIIEVNLGDLIPNNEYNYEVNLQRARGRWDQKKFEDGSWIEVYELDGRYFLPDGDHRVYVAYFEKKLQFAKAKLVERQDYEGLFCVWDPNMPQWEYTIDKYRTWRDEIAQQGVNSIKDLERRVLPGSWQDALRSEYGLPRCLATT
ncbi:MAG: hypothetical protein WC254_01240 [Candidatus Woesearchaeota archaeon]|jgi:hypothetical protein